MLVHQPYYSQLSHSKVPYIAQVAGGMVLDISCCWLIVADNISLHLVLGVLTYSNGMVREYVIRCAARIIGLLAGDAPTLTM